MHRLKMAFHVHTDYSDDGNAPVESFLAAARQCGVGCIAVTDHDTVAGAQALARLVGGELKVIVGEEISTSDGHLIGLFLHERIEPGLPARETARLIHRQGGLAIAPHPFNTIFGCSLREEVHELVDVLDAVEVCNAQNLFAYPNRRSEAFARQHGLPRVVGVDMHHRGYLDACFQWLPAFGGPAGFLTALGAAELVWGRHTLGYFARSARVELRFRLGLAPPPGYGTNYETARPKMALRGVPVTD